MPAGRTPDEYGKRMRQIRDALGLSQEDMAQQIGVRADTVSRYERGARHVPEPTMRLVESLLDKHERPSSPLAAKRARRKRQTAAPDEDRAFCASCGVGDGAHLVQCPVVARMAARDPQVAARLAHGAMLTEGLRRLAAGREL